MFKDRHDAGRQLASALGDFKGSEAIVCALPRGGVVIGFELARQLNLPLEVLVTRKIGAPQNPELAIGAVSEPDIVYIDSDLVRILRISKRELERNINKQLDGVARRIKLFRKGRKPRSLVGKTALIVDDGLATGATARAAIKAARKMGAKKIIFAAPVCAWDTVYQDDLGADKIICLGKQKELHAIGRYYEDFSQVDEGAVINYLLKAKKLEKNSR